MWKDRLKELIKDEAYMLGEANQIETFITDLLEKQRENCDQKFLEFLRVQSPDEEIREARLNAPEPEQEIV